MANDDPRTSGAAAGDDAPGRDPGSAGGGAGKPGTPGTAAAGGGGKAAAPPAPVYPPPPMNEKLATLRETTTTTIAGLVVLATLGMLVWTFLNAGSDFAEQKDIMLYGLPILGTVLGYYFGRVPAERRAESAEQGRGQAQATATQAVQEAASARETGEQHSRDKRDAERKLGVAAAANESAKQSLAKVLGAAGAAGGGGKPQRKTLGAPEALGGEPAGDDLDAVREAYLELQAASRLL